MMVRTDILRSTITSMKKILMLLIACAPLWAMAQKQDPRILADERMRQYRAYLPIADQEAEVLMKEFIKMEEQLAEMRSKVAELQGQLDANMQRQIAKIDGTLKPEHQEILAHMRKTGKFSNGINCDKQHCCVHTTDPRGERALSRPAGDRLEARPATQERPAR